MSDSANQVVSIRMKLGFDTAEEFEAAYARYVDGSSIFLASRSPRPLGTKLRFELQTRGGERLILAEGEVVEVVEVGGEEGSEVQVSGMKVCLSRLSRESRERVQRMSAVAQAKEVAVDPDSVPAPSPAPIRGLPLDAWSEEAVELPVAMDDRFDELLKLMDGRQAVAGEETESSEDAEATLPFSGVGGSQQAALAPITELPADAILDL